MNPWSFQREMGNLALTNPNYQSSHQLRGKLNTVFLIESERVMGYHPEKPPNRQSKPPPMLCFHPFLAPRSLGRWVLSLQVPEQCRRRAYGADDPRLAAGVFNGRASSCYVAGSLVPGKPELLALIRFFVLLFFCFLRG